MQAHDLLTDCQQGFCCKRSCNTQLPEVIEDLTIAIEINQPVDMIFFDLRKTFDSVHHQRLITILILNWIRNFLCERQQDVKAGNIFYKTTDMTSGVSQGSILGPILFIIYINDLPDCVSSSCKIFADDTKFYNFFKVKCFAKRFKFPSTLA